MKVHLLGNTCNNNYSILTFLRKLGVDAHLFYNSSLDIQTFPESDDSTLRGRTVDYLHPYTPAEAGPEPFLSPTPALLAKIADCDVVQAEDVGLVWASLTGRPYAWWPYGFDLKFYSFHSYWREHWGGGAANIMAPIAYRKAIAMCDAIMISWWYAPNVRGYDLVDRLAGRERVTRECPVHIDADKFCPGGTPNMAELLAKQGSAVKVEGIKLFHPTRIMFTEKSYVSKANDRLFKALGRLERAGIPFTLVVVEKGTVDEPDAKQLIADLGIAHRVAWVPKMTREQLIQWYRVCDIVPNEFVNGAPGSVSAESMACGAAHLTDIKVQSDDPSFWPPSEVYAELPPILSASTEEEIFGVLAYYATHMEELKDLGRKSREWVLANMAGEVVARRYIQVYERILSRKPSERKKPDDILLQIAVRQPQPFKPEEFEVFLREIEKAPRDVLVELLANVQAALEEGSYHGQLLIALSRLFAKLGAPLIAQDIITVGLHLCPKDELLWNEQRQFTAAARHA